MHETLSLLGAGVAGLALGGLFFGGLWWTVRKSVTSRRPALLFVSSFVLRTGLTLAGFYWVGGAAWQRLLLCLLGFVIARFVVLRLTRPVEHDAGKTAETCHAP